jgi:deazaflavin-dependent oxidoreductase (nitroreductase family)
VAIKVPPKGTRGVPFPRFLTRFGGAWVRRQFRRGTLLTQGGIPTLMLETTGAKSGLPRQAALGYLEDGSGSWIVIASMAGASYHPAWLHNLAKDPDATIEFKDRPRIPVRAEALQGAELEAAWARIARDAPEYVKYRSKTDRELVVVRLRQRA